MRRFLILLRPLVMATLAALMLACAGTPAYNPTVFPYEMDTERMAQSNIRTVVIPHVNLGPPSRNYLDEAAPRIDGMISTYLKENGFTVLPQREFKQHWNTAVRAFGDPVDPTTGKINMNTFARIMQSVRDEMRRTTDLDAFVFTDLVELQTSFSQGLNHLARWDGVTRKPSLQGPGQGVTTDFDWNMLAAVVSLQVSIYDMELQRVFASRGGIDATDAIDTRSSSGRYVRRNSILENEDFIMEGIRLAFYPFIETEDWPGNP